MPDSINHATYERLFVAAGLDDEGRSAITRRALRRELLKRRRSALAAEREAQR